MSEKNKLRPTLKEISSAASIYFGVDISLDTRISDVRRPRQIAHYVAHKIYKYSQYETGREMGGKDHATVLNSCKKVSEELTYSERMVIDVRRLNTMCENKDFLGDTKEICFGLLRRSDISAHAKIEIRKLLKILKYENN